VSGWLIANLERPDRDIALDLISGTVLAVAVA
jgi:hypothetical protein